MSSSNRVRISAIAETTYGTTPGTGNFTEIRKTSEDLSGSPQTVESAEIRSDRNTSGQISTGLELSGGFNFELTYDASVRLFLEQAMMSDLQAPTVHTGDLDITTGGTVLTTDGSFTGDGIQDGDLVVLSGFSNANNNVPVMVSNVTAGSMDIVGAGLTDENGGTTATVPAYYEIGSSPKSTSICKEYLDLDDGNVRSVSYTGMRVNEMQLTFAFGAISTGRFSFAGNGYDLPTDPMTNGRTVDAPGSDTPMDASNGFGWLLIDNADVDICLESLGMTVNNNLQAQNCIGRNTPRNQILGSAGVNFTGTMHLGLNSFDNFMQAKIDQTPMSIAYYVLDDQDQGYGVVLERVQVNFPDPAATGLNANVTLEAEGVASYDAGTARTMRLYVIT